MECQYKSGLAIEQGHGRLTLNAYAIAMRLVQILLPVYDNAGRPCPKGLVEQVRQELTDMFGGVTLYLRSPAVGAWEKDSGAVCRDDVILVEVMVDATERAWWTDYRHELEQRFSQDQILIRATDVDML